MRCLVFDEIFRNVKSITEAGTTNVPMASFLLGTPPLLNGSVLFRVGGCKPGKGRLSSELLD